MRDEAAGGDLGEWHHLRYIIPPNRDVALLNGAPQAGLAPPAAKVRLATSAQCPGRGSTGLPICMVPSGTGRTARLAPALP